MGTISKQYVLALVDIYLDRIRAQIQYQLMQDSIDRSSKLSESKLPLNSSNLLGKRNIVFHTYVACRILKGMEFLHMHQ